MGPADFSVLHARLILVRIREENAKSYGRRTKKEKEKEKWKIEKGVGFSGGKCSLVNIWTHCTFSLGGFYFIWATEVVVLYDLYIIFIII